MKGELLKKSETTLIEGETSLGGTPGDSKSAEDLAVNPNDDLVDIIFGKPGNEISTGDRLTRLHAIKRVVRKYGESGLTQRDFLAVLLATDIQQEYGFPKEETVSLAKLNRWINAKSDGDLSDGRFYNRRRRMIADKTCALVIQILRGEFRIKPNAVLRRIEEKKEEAFFQDLIIPRIGALKNLIRFLREHNIPRRINAASSGQFYKQFGIRIEHGWEYSNQRWQTDAATSRFLCYYNGQLINAHAVAMVDCYSSLVIHAELFPYYPGAAECLYVMMMALLPKTDIEGRNPGGFCEGVIFDQHGQFHSPIFRNPNENIGIITYPIPQGQSPHNGKVERSFGTFRTRYESDFPEFLKKRARFAGEDRTYYTCEFFQLKEDFNEWHREQAFMVRSKEDGLTAYGRWVAGLKPGYNPFPPELQKSVRDHFVIWEDVKIDGNCVVLSKRTGLEYTSASLKDMQGYKIQLSVGLMGRDPDVRAVYRGHDLGFLRRTSIGCDLANSLNAANLQAAQKAYDAGKTLKKWVGSTLNQSPRLAKIRNKKVPQQVVTKVEAIKLY